MMGQVYHGYIQNVRHLADVLGALAQALDDAQAIWIGN
jgi:hypothetical protein